MAARIAGPSIPRNPQQMSEMRKVYRQDYLTEAWALALSRGAGR